MFKCKIYGITKQPNLFGIADEILIVGYDADGKDHGSGLRQVMQICHKETLN